MTNQIVIERDGERPLRFHGEILGESGTSNNNANTNYSGTPGRWIELSLYKTASGRHVAARVHGTCWQGEKDQHEAIVGTLEECIAWLGFDSCAKRLYAKAGIDTAEEVA